MGNAGERLRLTNKTRVRVSRMKLRPNDFYCDKTIQSNLSGENYDPHAAVTQLAVAFDLVTLLRKSDADPLEERGHGMISSELPGAKAESQTHSLDLLDGDLTALSHSA